jgi:hypothetical protein
MAAEPTYATAELVDDVYEVEFSEQFFLSYFEGQSLRVKFIDANPEEPTIKFKFPGQELTVKTITYQDGSAIEAGAIIGGSIHSIVFDGINFQLLGASAVVPPTPTPTLSEVLTAGSDAENQPIENASFLELVQQEEEEVEDPSPMRARLYTEDFHGFNRSYVLNELGQKIYFTRDDVIIVKNDTGGTLIKGTPVYVNGATGNVPNVAKARANSINTLPAIGLVLDDIDDNSFGQVIVDGKLSMFDTSDFDAGDRLFVSAETAGELTNEEPQRPNRSQIIGVVLVSGVGNGAVEVKDSVSVTPPSLWQPSKYHIEEDESVILPVKHELTFHGEIFNEGEIFNQGRLNNLL